MSSENRVAIEATGLSKCYRLYEKPSHRLKQALPWQRERFYREFWALRDVSLTLPQGQTLGVIGRNGSGKSTLLQLICGTLTPTEGKVHVNGRIGALLELGSGFNPEFTGLENVRLNAAVLGLKEREINEKLDAILAFADIGSFVNQPVKHYSSGMVVRLAFAVQAHIDPAILVVDEALAVGDELFQKKCFARLEQLKQRGTSILLVSHSCSQINQHCDQVLLLHKGKPQLTGEPHRITALYQRLIQGKDKEWEQVIFNEEREKEALSKNLAAFTIDSRHRYKEKDADSEWKALREPWLDPELKSSSTISYPCNGAEIESISIHTIDGKEINTLPHGVPFDISVVVRPESDLESIRIGCFIANQNGGRITGQSAPRRRGEGISVFSSQKLSVRFKFQGGLWPGYYFVGAGVSETSSRGMFLHRVIDRLVLRVIDTDLAQPIGNTDLTRLEHSAIIQ